MLATLIGAFLSGEAAAWFRRAKTAAIIYILATLLALTGVGFLIGAAYIATARRYGDLAAAIAFGVAFIVLALIVLAIRAAASARARRDHRPADLATLAGTAAISAMPLVRRHKAAALVAPLIGVAAYFIFREVRRRRSRPLDRA